MTSGNGTVSRRRVRAHLEPLFLFEGWAPADLDHLERIGRMTVRAKDEMLFFQDDPCAFLYVLLRGKVQMFRSLPDGRQVTIHVLGPGDLVACAALFLDACFPASARVVSKEAELVCLEGKAFLKLLERRPDLARKMIGALAMRISSLAHSLESRTVQSAVARLAAWLLEQPSAKTTGGARLVRIEGSKKTLAADLGITPETFSRSLRKLAEDGLIAARGKQITLLNANRLLETADSGVFPLDLPGGRE